MISEWWLLVVGVGLLTIFGSGVGTLTGFGTSTIMVPVLVVFLPFPQVLLLVGVIHWFTDVWKMGLFREGLEWRLVLLFGVPGVVATHLAARIVFDLPTELLTRVLGVFLMAYVAFLFLREDAQLPETAGIAVAGGALYGVFAGLFGVGGAVRGAFLAAFDLPKAVYIATTGAISLAIDSIRIATYVDGGATLPSYLLYGFVLFVPASLLGSKLAERIVDRIPQESFRNVVAGFLFLVALQLVLAPSL